MLRLGATSCPGGTDQGSPRNGECMIALYQEKTAWGSQTCKFLSLFCPSLCNRDTRVPPIFSTAIGHHTACLSGQDVNATRPLGECTLCIETIYVVEDLVGNYVKLRIPRTNCWWYCRGKALQSTLPSDLGGTCALVHLAIPFTLAFDKESPCTPQRNRSLGISSGKRIYINSIGVPKEIPDEHKVRNQTVAWSESSLFWWITVNKNVGWINYIYHNQQRFINYTRDAIEGIAELLGATGRITWENRIALDMMQAEKGQVCVNDGQPLFHLYSQQYSPKVHHNQGTARTRWPMQRSQEQTLHLLGGWNLVSVNGKEWRYPYLHL